jgi:hypothetical protein
VRGFLPVTIQERIHVPLWNPRSYCTLFESRRRNVDMLDLLSHCG